MIRLVFTQDREFFRIEIKGREVFYADRIWKRAIRLIPKDEEFRKKILLSRNKIPAHFINFFNLTNEEQEEYDNAKTENELADICVKDCRKKGALLELRKEYGEL